MKRLALAAAASAGLLLVVLGLWRWSSHPDLSAQLQPVKQQSRSDRPATAQPNASEQANTQKPPAAPQQSAEQQPPSPPASAQQSPVAQQSAKQTPGPAEPRAEPSRQADVVKRQTIPFSELRENQIRDIQQALNQKGFNLATDGKWGARTRTALRDFSRSQKLPGGQALNMQTVSALGFDPASFGVETTGQAGPAAAEGGRSRSPGASMPPARSNGGGT